MSGPREVFTDYAQLASKISQHLALNPHDTQAQEDLKYVTGKMQGGVTQAANAQDVAEATGPSDPHPGFSIASGLTQAATDIPKGIGQALMHPIQTAGQMTGLGNLPAAVKTWNDPESSLPEDLDALVRATPFNMGYAPERALEDATGAKSDDTAPLEEQAHRAGNVASLALLGVNPRTAGSLLTRRVGGALGAMARPMVESAFKNVIPAASDASGEAASGGGGLIQGGAEGEAELRQRLKDLGQSPERIERQISLWKGSSPTTATPSAVAPTVPSDPDAVARAMPGPPPRVPDPLDEPTFIRRGGTANGRGAVTPAPKTPLPEVGVDAPEPEPPPEAPPTAPVPTTPPTPPAPAAGAPPANPALADLGKGEQFPYYPRGGKVEQGMEPPPQETQNPAATTLKSEHLKMLLGAPEEQFQASRGVIPKDIFDQVDALRKAGATPDHVDAMLQRTAAPATVSGVSDAMRNPMYQRADVVAKQILDAPVYAKQYGYTGMSLEQVTAALRQRMVDLVAQGKKIPPLTSFPRFLARLHGTP